MKSSAHILLLLAGSLLYATASFAQFSIADARNNYSTGQQVTVSGIVTNGSEIGGSTRYLQDNTAGIACYPGSGSVAFSPSRGDSITVTGTLKDYNGLLEIDPISAYTNHGSGYILPTPLNLTPAQMGESTESELLEFTNVTIDSGGSTFQSSTSYEFHGNGESADIYIGSGSSLIGQPIPTVSVNLTGISSQYTWSSPANDGYQLLPRDMNDIVPRAIHIIDGPDVANITTSSFDLEWTTDSAGTSNLEYGTTQAMTMGTINQGGSNTSHSISITGLQPAEFYYARVYSTRNGDTAYSETKLYSTASNSTGEMNVYFNRDVDTTYSTGTYAEHISFGFDDTIESYIDKAQTTLDMAGYNINDTGIVNHLNDAYNRGVQVRYVADSSTNNTALTGLNSGVDVVYRPEGGAFAGIMHNKFIVVDAGKEDSSWVLTGSTNFTQNNLFYDFNNMVLIQDQSIAKAYELEFEEMWGSSTAIPDTSQSRFGADKSDNTPHFFNVNGTEVELYFSPSDNVTDRFLELFTTIDHELHFALLAFTYDNLSASVVNAHNSGYLVNGIIEMVNITGSDYNYLQNNNVDVMDHSGVSDVIHHKYALIDPNNTGTDAMVITGSHNWTAAAEEKNDENTLVIHDQEIANQFYQEFKARFQSTVAIEENKKSEKNFQIHPNPAQDQIQLSFEETTGKQASIRVMDLQGKVIMERTLPSKTKQHGLNIEGLSPGYYQVQVTGEEVETRGLIIR